MSYYSNNPAICRIDLFLRSGKWYATGSINMEKFYTASIHSAVFTACVESHELGELVHEGWPLITDPETWVNEGGMIICLQPYHQYSHPIMLKESWPIIA